MALTRVKKVSNASLAGSISADKLAGSISADKLNIGQIGGRRNIIINGAMQVAQRATSATGLGDSDIYAVCDRWKLVKEATTAGRLTMSQDSSAPSGFGNSLKLDCTTADTSIAAGEVLLLQQRIEGQNLQAFAKGTSDAKEFSVSFYVKGNASATYVCELHDQDNSRQCSKTFNVTTSWTRIELLFPADTTGAFDDDNARSLNLNIALNAGSDYTSGTLNSSAFASNTNANRYVGISSFFDSTDRTFFITGVQLEVGSQATPFEHRSYAEELELCKRYFQKFGGGANKTIAHVYAPSTSELALLLRFAPELRTSPSLDWSSDTTDLTYRYSGNNSQNFDRGDLNDDGTVGQVTPQGGSMWMHGWSHGQSSNDGGEIRVLAVSPEEFLFLQFDAEL